ncbi:MAG: protein O-mannosyl-transferase family [Calditrichota bacterium]
MVKFDTHRWCATAVFAASLIIYALTMAGSVSFWDCGEFAACAYTMSVPHPPGSPLFLLIGRVFSLLPISSDIAVRVTWMSVLSSAFAVLFAYLIIVRLVRMIRGPETTVADKIIAYGGGIIGALSLSWSYSMWFNAVESEVYAMSQFFTHIVFWLILVWYEKADEPGNERILLLIAYMIGLSTGVHLLMILVLPAIALLMYFRRRSFELKSFIGMMAATAVVFIMIYPGVVKWLPLSASKTSLWAPLLISLGIGLIFWWAAKNRHGIIGVSMAGLLLVIVGYSTYSMIYIRSGLNPGIDENDPDTPARFFSYLNREQYGDRPMFPRVWNNDPEYRSESDYFWRYQVNKMFNRYLLWQFVGREGAPHSEYQDAGVSPKYSLVSLFTHEPSGFWRWLGVITSVPFLLGLAGFVYQYMKDKKGWLVISLLFVMTGYAVIIYLNQDNPQPRERDYSYVGAFFAFALWIGIGAAAVIEWAKDAFKKLPSANTATAGVAAILFVLSPVMLLAQNYPMNDRHGNHVAWDYSYNMLMSCEPNGIIFTNGDNDTFPVWYMQEVERVRRDVRLVNLSLLNTGWYIKQLKDREPQVPISFSDSYVDRYFDQHDVEALRQRFWPPEKQKIELNTPQGKMSWTMPATMFIPIRDQGQGRQNNFLRVQDIMILDILRTNYDASKTPVPKPIYFAVTVANSNMIGLRDYLTMEGLVFRINPRGRQPIDAEAIRKSLFETFKGHFRGIADPNVHYDDNVQKLLQNYRSAFLQLAYHYSTLPSGDNSPSPYQSLDDRIANFDKLSNREKALTVMMQMDALIPEAVRPISNVDLSLQLGKMYADLGQDNEFRRRLEMASARNDLRPDTEARLASYWAAQFGDTARANRILAKALGPAPTAEEYRNIGRELFGGGALELAAQYFEKAFEMDPNDGQTIGALIQIYETNGNLQAADRVLEQWVARHPGDRGAIQRHEQIKAQLAGDTNRSSSTVNN